MSALRFPVCVTWILLAAPGWCQFTELVATDDGKQLLFTSQKRMKGMAPSLWPESRLYQHGPGGVSLVAERGALAPPSSFGSGDGVASPSISGDGSVIGFTFNGVCRTPTNCTEVVSGRVEVRGQKTFELGEGVVQISRDGLWALVLNEIYDYSAPGMVGVIISSTLVELSTGQRTTPPSPPFFQGHPSQFTLASNGAVLCTRPDPSAPPGIGGVTPPEYGVWRRGQFSRIALPAGEVLSPFAISGDADNVVSYAYSPLRIVVTSLRLGKSTTVFDGADPEQQTPVFLAVSNNGNRILYLLTTPDSLNGPSFVWDAATAASSRIPLDAGEYATGGTLSGDGTVAFVATTHSRIVKFDTRSKTVSPLFPQTPFCEDPGPLAGGSIARLRCMLPNPAEPLEGKIQYDGQAMTVLYAGPSEIGVQIPWEWDNFIPPTLSLNVTSDSPFEASQPLRVYDGAPAIWPNDTGEPSLFGIKIVKGDWSGLLNSVPAPGEVFYIYMTGLGWVQRREATGVPATPAPNPILWNLDCRFLPDYKPAELLFAGLAPGTIGVYQTAFRMPLESSGAQMTGIRCSLSSPVMGVEFGPGLPVRGVMGRGGFGSLIGQRAEPAPTPPHP